MKGLLIKDIKLLENQKRTFLFILCLGIFTGMSTAGELFIVSYLGFIGIIFALGTISYDEFDNGNAFLFSLPISRKLYAKEKYLFVMMFGIAVWLLAALICTGITIFKGSAPLPDMIGGSLLILAVMLLIIDVMLPIQLKFGAERGKIAFAGVGGVFFLLIMVAVKGLSYLRINVDELLSRITTAWAAFILGALLILATWFSLRISTRIMEKKEF